jgi:hypothetical protein
VHQDQRADPIVALEQRALHDMQRTLAQADHRVRLPRGARRRPAPERHRIGRRRIAQLSFFIAKSQRVQPFVLQRPHEHLLDLGRRALLDDPGELVLQRVGDQLRACVEVVDPPAQR